MLMYIDPANKKTYSTQYQELVTNFARAASVPELQKGLIEVVQTVAAGNFYNALRQCRKLFDIEDHLLNPRTAS